MEWIDPPDCSKLPLPRRIAWATVCLERAFASYSSYFRGKYLTDEMLDMAWQYAITGHDDTAARRALVQRGDALSYVADDEGYFRWCVLTLVEVLMEIDRQDGANASDAVDMGSEVFAIGVWFRVSTDPRRIRIPMDDFARLRARFLSFSHELFDALAQMGNAAVQRTTFDHIPLDTTYERLKDVKSTLGKDFDFPPHERPAAMVQRLAELQRQPRPKLPARITRRWLAGICARWHLNPPAAPGAIDAGESNLGLRFPREYVAFLRAANGMKFFDLDDPPPDLNEAIAAFGPVGSLLVPDCCLFDIDKVLAENRLWQVTERAPGCLVIGHLGDEGPIFLHLARGDARRAPVYQQQAEDFGVHADSGVHVLYGRKANSLKEWLAAGCPLPEAKSGDDE